MDIYTHLTYDQYKDLERQLANYDELETTHETFPDKHGKRYYHKSFRLCLGDLTIEFHGPTVMGESDGS